MLQSVILMKDIPIDIENKNIAWAWMIRRSYISYANCRQLGFYSTVSVRRHWVCVVLSSLWQACTPTMANITVDLIKYLENIQFKEWIQINACQNWNVAQWELLKSERELCKRPSLVNVGLAILYRPSRILVQNGPATTGSARLVAPSVRTSLEKSLDM